MDSGNSGSIQSSSDGGNDDQEYNSHTDSISAYFNPTPPPPPPPHHNHNSNSPLQPFDPNSLLNFNPIWPNPPGSDPTQPFFRPSPTPPVRISPVTSDYNNNTVTTTTTTAQRAYTDHALGARGNPKKKRSRASRRAPTTVLTTDTTNFRAMVQEFTGIPPPPFSSSSSPLIRSSGFDLFGAPSSIRSNPFLLRPCAQKFQPPPPPNTTTINYQMQNPNQIFDPKKNPLSDFSNGSVVLDEFGLGRRLSNGENPFSVDGNERISMGWAGAGVGPSDTDQSNLRLVNGSYEYSHGSGNNNGNGNLVNFSASSPDFHGDKRSENVPVRGEGNLEPWICSSD